MTAGWGAQLKCIGCCVPAPCDVQHCKFAARGLLSFLSFLGAFLPNAIKRNQGIKRNRKYRDSPARYNCRSLTRRSRNSSRAVAQHPQRNKNARNERKFDPACANCLRTTAMDLTRSPGLPRSHGTSFLAPDSLARRRLERVIHHHHQIANGHGYSRRRNWRRFWMTFDGVLTLLPTL